MDGSVHEDGNNPIWVGERSAGDSDDGELIILFYLVVDRFGAFFEQDVTSRKIDGR